LAFVPFGFLLVQVRCAIFKSKNKQKSYNNHLTTAPQVCAHWRLHFFPGAARFLSLACSFVGVSARLGLQGVEMVLTVFDVKAKEDDAQ
jgi:hypothetical protein